MPDRSRNCNKRFIKVDSPNVQFISKLSASFIYYSLSVNFFSEIFFFEERHSWSQSFHLYIRGTKFMMPNTSFLTTAVTLPSAGIAILVRLTIADKMADHSCSSKRSMERVGKLKNANKAKKCNTTCDLIPLSEINTQHHKRTHNFLA